MRKMVNLVRNENMKLSHSISTWIMIAVLVVITIGVGLLIRFTGSKAPTSDWKADIRVQNQEIVKSINEPQMPKIQKDSLTKELQTNEYRLKHDIQPLKERSLWGFVEDAVSLIALISLFSIIMGGKIVANEFSEGTIKLLLIRPSNRWKVLLSKYVAVIGYTLLMLLVLLVVSILVGGTLFSFKGASTPFLTNSSGIITEVNMIAHIAALYGLQCINLVMMVTLAFMISTVFRNSAMAIGIGVFLLSVGNTVTMLLLRYNWSKYILFANTDLSQYIDGQPLVKGMTLKFSIIVLIVYFIVFNVISYIGFTKRDIVA